MKKIILMISLIALIFSGCKKKEDPTPAPVNNNTNTTKTKSGVLICKVNGVNWQSDTSSKMAFLIDTLVRSTGVFLEADTMSIHAISNTGTDSSCILFNIVLKPGRTGTYTLSGVGDNSGAYIPGTDLGTLLGIAFGYSPTGTLEITKFDATNKKMSGKFSITMTPDDQADPKYTVTEGTFTDLIID